ncbi:NAD(P)/FAD-dependent oxidoreductase [Labilibacter sediminis]|nr:NAD(P)/FAD-dependent oxidoreductase [Labilibacter sediminis]
MIIKDFVIIGAGIAGFSAIKAIREETKEKSILWITNEDRIPYKRTKINKNIAKGFNKNDFALIEHDWLVDNHIELLYDEVTEIKTDKNELIFNHRGHLRYKKLIIATGNTPNPLNINNLPAENIHHIHSARQAENIIRTTRQSNKYLIIGAGVEGVEIADQLIKLKKEVVLVEKNKEVISRFFNPRFSQLMRKSIINSGINLITEVKNISYKESLSDQAIIEIDGIEYEFDTIISTIGYTPNIKLADDSYITCDKGILVNEKLETSAQDVYAAGDVAQHPSGEITGLWHAAEKQGYIAGKNAAGQNLQNILKPFRMKTEVFNEFYFSALPPNNDTNVITEEKENMIRELYFKNNKLQGVLMLNDQSRAKTYQRALMEQWTPDEINKKLPL